MSLTCVDWCESDALQMAALYDAEVERWSRTLGWETAASWKEVDRGRKLGTVIGRLALHADRTCAGWTFAIVHRSALQIGGLVASSESATSALVHSVCESPAASSATSVSLFAWPDAPGLERVLTRRGLIVDEYDYLAAPLPVDPTRASFKISGCSADPQVRLAPAGLKARTTGFETVSRESTKMRPWCAADFTTTVELLSSAYSGSDPARPFAAGGTLSEWREYAAGLVGTSSCGAFMRDSSLVAADSSGRPIGMVLVTRLSAATAHLAQLVVAPDAQQRGLGRLLLHAARLSAGRAGCDRMTLLVARPNARARRLYEQSGFSAVTTFVSARSRKTASPTRSPSE